ncbi:MAG: ribbon-helix-helix protein, CopG family [Lentisphaerae bacterium]|nr:ribbon-helix-helix protein, CopG family [Lentisphaerota bacterium]
MTKLVVELPGVLIEMIDNHAKKDGHNNRSAVVRKALNSFFAAAAPAIIVAPAKCIQRSQIIGVQLADDMIERIDQYAAADGHNNRSAVVRKAVNYFFAR